MCKPKPGPRCSRHAFKSYQQVARKYAALKEESARIKDEINNNYPWGDPQARESEEFGKLAQRQSDVQDEFIEAGDALIKARVVFYSTPMGQEYVDRKIKQADSDPSLNKRVLLQEKKFGLELRAKQNAMYKIFLQDRNRKSLQDGTPVIPIPKGTSPATVKKLERKYPHASIVVGRVNAREELSSRKYSRMQSNSEMIIAAFTNSEGEYVAPSVNALSEENSIYLPDGFKLIGSGAQRNTYLHEASGYVYKVPNKRRYSKEKEQEVAKMFLLEQQSYAELDTEAMAEYNSEYVETCFTHARGVDVQIQKYLDPKKYRMVLMSDHEVEFNVSKIKTLHNLEDVHAGNYYINKETGRIVFFDCLALNDEVSRV